MLERMEMTMLAATFGLPKQSRGRIYLEHSIIMTRQTLFNIRSAPKHSNNNIKVDCQSLTISLCTRFTDVNCPNEHDKEGRYLNSNLSSLHQDSAVVSNVLNPFPEVHGCFEYRVHLTYEMDIIIVPGGTWSSPSGLLINMARPCASNVVYFEPHQEGRTYHFERNMYD